MRYVVLRDEEYRDKALQWIRQNSYSKGKPNMTDHTFCQWVNKFLLPEVVQHHLQVSTQISIRTATRWLHHLGFHPSSAHKGVYFDGHERSDVVDYRKLFLRKLEILEATHEPPPPCSDEMRVEPSDKKKLVLIYHNESTFHSNDGKGWVWAEPGKQPIRPKGQGQGIMVSDFIEEQNGFLGLSDEEYEDARTKHTNLWKDARFLLKYGKNSEGYWDSDKFMRQVEQAVTIAEIKYTRERYNLVFLFDQSSGHTAYAEDSLNANNMSVNPGGKQPKLRDTMWDGKVQKMTFPDGTPKGMRRVLEERGVDTE